MPPHSWAGSRSRRVPRSRRARSASPRAARRSRSRRENLAWIHDAVGIERLLYAAHQLDLDRRFVMRELLALQSADAMLGADRAVEAYRDVVDDAVELLAPLQEHLGVGGDGLVDVVVDVAVADMAERVGPDAGQALGDRLVRELDEVRDLAHRHRDVVLVAAAFVLLRLDHAFA